MTRIQIDPGCRRCPFGPEVRRVSGEGQPGGLLVLGEAPHISERATGRPFSGSSGKLLRTLLDKLETPYYLSNAVRCQTKDFSQEVVANCRHWTEEEVQQLQPRVLVALGSVAASQFGLAGVRENRGRVHDINGLPLVVSWHPAAVLRDNSLLLQLWADLQLAKKAAEGLEEVEVPYSRVDDPHKLAQWIRQEPTPLAIDIETEGLQWTKHRVISVQFSRGGEAVICPPDLLESPEVQEALLGAYVVGHNLPYDLGFLLYHYGLQLKPAGDSMLAAHFLNENLPKSLKQLVSAEFGVADWSAETRADYAREDYAARDVFWTHRLVKRVHELLQPRRVWTLYHEAAVPAVAVVARAHAHGVWVDSQALAEAEETVYQERQKVLEKLSQWASINWRSSAQVANYLYRELGLPVVETTPQGGPSSKESALKRLWLEAPHPVVELLLEYRRWDKAETGFIKPWRELMVNSRLYPKWNMTGTVTGRFSCTNPNLQQVPRDPLLRRAISAPPGYVLIEADLSQAELRIAAVLAREETMLSLLRGGQDIHAYTAKLLSGKDISEIPESQRKEWRKKAKAVNFGFLYGMGARKFQETALDKFNMIIPLGEAERFRSLFFSSYPRLSVWHREVMSTLRRQGYVENVLGRRRTPLGPQDQAEREAVNFVVQSLAADVVLAASTQITKGVVVGFIHDALLIEAPEDRAEEAQKEVIELLRNPPIFKRLGISEFDGVLDAEAKEGPWGS